MLETLFKAMQNFFLIYHVLLNVLSEEIGRDGQR